MLYFTVVNHVGENQTDIIDDGFDERQLLAIQVKVFDNIGIVFRE